MNLKLLKVITATGFLLAGIGCKKQDLPLKQIESGTTVNPALVYHKPVTPEELLLVDNLGKVTGIFKELYKNNSNLKVVNGAIMARSYTDQSILLKDLIYPQNSRLSLNKRFIDYAAKQNISLNAFAANFWKEANKRNDQPFKVFLEALKPFVNFRSTNEADGNEVTVYFPYSEAFEQTQNLDESPRDHFPDTEDRDAPSEPGGDMPISTIVTATADADEGIGYKPYYDIYGQLQYKEVIVNDDYAYQNPTHIIGLNGIEPYEGISSVISEAFPPQSPIDLPDLHREVKQVYVGDVRCTANYDPFISMTGNGGGSEIRFTRADGFLKVVDGQVQTADVYFTPDKPISRGDIRKKQWVDFSYEWDGDWELSNLQQNLAIYEEDNRNTITYTGALNTTVTVSVPIPPATVGTTVERRLGFTINFKSDDPLIRQSNYNRDVFFALNRTNLEGEMYNGWPVRDRTGPVSFTLNDRTYY